MSRGRSRPSRPFCGGCVKRKGAWQLAALLIVVAAVSFVLGYVVMIRFIL